MALFCFSVDVIKFMEMAKDRIPNLKGLKHSSKELPNAHGCKLIDNGRFQVLNGTDNVSSDKTFGLKQHKNQLLQLCPFQW